MTYGPTNSISDQLHATKYRQPNESFEECMNRIAAATADDEKHRQKLKDILLNMRFLPAGRIQSTVGSSRVATPFNCFVSDTIEDSLYGIMDKVKEAALTLQKGGGIGFDFSTLRYRGAPIVHNDGTASGPVSFMGLYNEASNTIMAAGHRRGAMMAVLRVDHPDIELFIRSKQNNDKLTNFNISVGVTNKFMEAVLKNDPFDLVFEGKVVKQVEARGLWDEIMRATWDWAEPGVLFLDTINKNNNLYYCEEIKATNPCGEQPLPPYGACLLGSFNLVNYVYPSQEHLLNENIFDFNFHKFREDIPHVVRAMDNIIDIADFPLIEQKTEALLKRRMGLGITGLGNTLTALGYSYGSEASINFVKTILGILRDDAYIASTFLAKEKGSFPLYNKDYYLIGEYIQKLPDFVWKRIKENGIRNSHLTSVAPAGTISFCADNISSGLEPTFSHIIDRPILTEDGMEVHRIKDFAYDYWGIKGETTKDLTMKNHLDILLAATPYVDSAISKTINVGEEVSFNEFKEVYMNAWLGGAKGCTTHRLKGKRKNMMENLNTEQIELEEYIDSLNGSRACFIDPNTGNKTCDE